MDSALRDSAGEAADGLPEAIEREALRALDRGDRKEVLNMLMDAYGAALYRYCCLLTAEEDLAQDVHQLAFVQAYEGLGRFARRSSLRTWLYGIARHRCLDALKQKRRRDRRFRPLEEPADRPAADPDAEGRLAAREHARALEECLGRLQPKIRAAVLLRYREAVSYPEMARICRERPATLQARVARALPALRRCLEEQGVTP